MKKYAFGFVVGLLALGVHAQEAVGDVPAVPAVAAEPMALQTTQHPELKAFLEKSGASPLMFRPSENMPEIVNEDLLKGMVEVGEAPDNVSDFIGYMPRLVVLPCEQGCEGADYEKAVKAFVAGYQGKGKHFKERGEMRVQVRWFNVRPFLMRQLPYGSDLFGVSFIVEGKLVSLGKKSGVGISVSAHELAKDLGARLAVELAFTVGVGAKPTFLQPMNKNSAGGLGEAIMASGAAVDGVLGVEDVRSRIEPVTEAHMALLPAIDGVLPGEVEPIAQMQYINSLMF